MQSVLFTEGACRVLLPPCRVYYSVRVLGGRAQVSMQSYNTELSPKRCKRGGGGGAGGRDPIVF